MRVIGPTPRDGQTRTLTHPKLQVKHIRLKAKLVVLVLPPVVVHKPCPDLRLDTKLVEVLHQALVVVNSNNRRPQLMMLLKCHTLRHNSWINSDPSWLQEVPEVLWDLASNSKSPMTTTPRI